MVALDTSALLENGVADIAPSSCFCFRALRSSEVASLTISEGSRPKRVGTVTIPVSKRSHHVDHMAILLACVEAHAAADHLYQKVAGLGRSGEQDAVNVWHISAFSEDSTIQENGKLATLEGLKSLAALFLACRSGDVPGIDATFAKGRGQACHMFEVDTKDQGRLPVACF